MATSSSSRANPVIGWLKVTISSKTVQGQESGASVVRYFEIPSERGNTAARSSRARPDGSHVKYFHVEEQPDAPALDLGKVVLTPALGEQGNGTIRLAGLEGAFSRGATVELTNMRYEAENIATGGKSEIVTSREHQRPQLSVRGQEGDRLRLRVSYPGRQPVEKFLEVPSGAGKAAHKEGETKFYSATAAE